MIADKIKSYLTENEIKQVDLANALGISKQLLSTKLNGKCRISAEEFIEICQFLGVDCMTFRPDSNMSNTD